MTTSLSLQVSAVYFPPKVPLPASEISACHPLGIRSISDPRFQEVTETLNSIFLSYLNRETSDAGGYLLS